MSEAAAIPGFVTPAPARTPAWPEAVIVAVAALTPFTAYLNSLGFAVVIAVAGLALLPLLFQHRRPLLGLVFLFGLALWALASMQWSVHTQQLDPTSLSPEDLTGAKMLLEVGLYGAFIVAVQGLSARSAGRAGLVLALGLLGLALIFIVEGVAKAGIYHWIRGVADQATDPEYAIRDVGRVAYVLVLLFWPVAIRLAGLRIGALPVGFLAVPFIAGSAMIGSAMLGVDAPPAAMAVSVLAFALVYFGGRAAIWLCLGGTILYLAGAPLLMLTVIPTLSQFLQGDAAHLSWAIRLDIWRFAAERILEHPFFGWGLDASRTFSPHIQLHPHDGALQLWLELGAVGVALAAVFWTWLFVRIAKTVRHDRVMAAAAVATASIYLTIGALSFGVWQEWWLALGALASAACLLGYRGRASNSSTESREPGVDQPGLAP